MNSPSDKQLDHLLQAWADEQSASPEKLASLQRQIVQKLSRVDIGDNRLPEVAVKRTQYRWAYATLAMAATVLILAATTWLYVGKDYLAGSAHVEIAADHAVEAADQVPDDVSWPKLLDHQSRLLAEYQNVFEQGVAWIAETNQRSEVGLQTAKTSIQPGGQQRYLAIRLRLLSRSATVNDWQEVRVVNLLVGEEELVQIPGSADGAGPLTIWAYSLDDQMVAIDLQYQPGNSDDLQFEADSLQRLGRTANVGTFHHDGVEYRLDQTADFVHGDDLG